MNKANFTGGRVDAFECPPGKQQSIFWDAKTPGLGLRATANGTKSYIFEARLNGKTVRVTIGDVRTWTVSQAQAEATKLKTLVDRGRDPRLEKAERLAACEARRVAAAQKEVTVREAWDAYIAARKPNWGSRHLLNHEYMANAGGQTRTRGIRKGESDTTKPGPLHSLLSMRLANLDSEAVSAWLKPLTEKTPTQAAQTYRALRAFVSWCADNPNFKTVAHADACTGRSIRSTLPRAKAKNDCLQREQLALWFLHVKKISNPVIAAYLQTALLTGARRNELSELRWNDVDFQWKSLTIHDKVDGERTIPLTPYVAALLASLPRRTKKENGEQVSNPYVFSSLTSQSGRLQEPRIQHNKAIATAGLPALSIHGLRRSFGTLAEWVECPAGISAQIMGHKPSALAEKHYRRRPLDLLRMWHTKIEAWILAQAGIEQPLEAQNVIS